MRLHPAASRVAKLAQQTPASFVAFDAARDRTARICAAGRSANGAPRLEKLLAHAAPPIHLTPMTRDRAQAADWLSQFEGAGLDGVMAKPANGTYQPGKRAMIKIKHARTADCVVAGFRWHKAGKGELVGSLLLGLFDAGGSCSTSASPRRSRWRCGVGWRRSSRRCASDALDEHPWREWADVRRRESRRAMPGGQSRWSAGKDLSWEPLRIERVCEVKYDHMQGDRFRHAAVFQRWRPDKPPEQCGYDQLEVTTPYELAKVFGASGIADPVNRGMAPRWSDPVFGHVLVRVERFLRRPQRVRHVLQVQADARPGAVTSAHRVHQHVGRLRDASRPQDDAPSTARSRRARRPCSRARPISMSGWTDVRRRDGATRGASPACFR